MATPETYLHLKQWSADPHYVFNAAPGEDISLPASSDSGTPFRVVDGLNITPGTYNTGAVFKDFDLTSDGEGLRTLVFVYTNDFDGTENPEGGRGIFHPEAGGIPDAVESPEVKLLLGIIGDSRASSSFIASKAQLTTDLGKVLYWDYGFGGTFTQFWAENWQDRLTHTFNWFAEQKALYPDAPAFCEITLGTNDAKRVSPVSVADYKSRLITICEAFTQNNITPILHFTYHVSAGSADAEWVPIADTNAQIDLYNQAILEIVAEGHAELGETISPKLILPGDKSDGVHPNAVGDAKVAGFRVAAVERVYAELVIGGGLSEANVATIAAAVRAILAPELARIDAPVSDAISATENLIIPTPPTPPSAAAIASTVVAKASFKTYCCPSEQSKGRLMMHLNIAWTGNSSQHNHLQPWMVKLSSVLWRPSNAPVFSSFTTGADSGAC
jgi:hypothetical protein